MPFNVAEDVPLLGIPLRSAREKKWDSLLLLSGASFGLMVLANAYLFVFLDLVGDTVVDIFVELN